MTTEYLEYPWSIRRNGRECARARTRREADREAWTKSIRIIQQLQKIHRSANFNTKYEGKNISHCGEGGKPLT